MKELKWWHIALVVLAIYIVVMIGYNRSQSGSGLSAPSAEVDPPKINYALEARILRDIGNIDYMAKMSSEDGYEPVEQLLSADRALIAKHMKSDIDSIKQLAKSAGLRLAKAQRKLYPQLRSKWAKAKAKAVWVDDMYVDQWGTTLAFTAADFAANRNIAKMQQAIEPIALRLRFKQTQYRWYRGQEEFTYYALTSKNDDDITP